MSGKSFVLKTPPTVAAAAENWVQTPAKAETKTRPAKLTRFTVELDEELHFRMKMYCTQHRLSMADYVREVLAERFPAVTSDASTAA